MDFIDYLGKMRKAMCIRDVAEELRMPTETPEVRKMVADLQLISGRLVKLLAKRVAGNVAE